MIQTNIDFPDYLPCPLLDGFKRQNNVSPFVRTDRQNGRAKHRRKFTAVPVEYDVSWLFRSDAEASLFESWFKNKVKDGTEWFNTLLRTPVGYKKYVCRFVDMYDGPDIVGGNMWKASARLEMYERPLMPSEWVEFPQIWLGMDIIDIAVNREWPEA